MIPFNSSMFMKECKVRGRLLRSYEGSARDHDYFIIKVHGQNLIQPYMIVLRTRIPMGASRRAVIVRYEDGFREALHYLSDRCSLSGDDILLVEGK